MKSLVAHLVLDRRIGWTIDVGHDGRNIVLGRGRASANGVSKAEQSQQRAKGMGFSAGVCLPVMVFWYDEGNGNGC